MAANGNRAVGWGIDRVLGLALLAAAGAACGGHGDAQAHLGLIRQEWESAGLAGAGDHHGYSLTVGDYNGDGREDLAMGAPDDDRPPLVDCGMVVVNFGTKHGLTHHSPDPQSLFSAAVENGIGFGFSLAAGDFDNDGYSDLVVGMPRRNVGTMTDAGAIRVFPGSASGLTGATAIDMDQSDAGAANEAGDNFGWVATTGRFNGDVFDDLVVGGPGEDGGEGAVYFFWGSPTGLGGGGFFKQIDLGGMGTAGDSLGYALTAGQLVGTSHEDLVIGVPYSDAGAEDAGRIYVVPGGAIGFMPGSSIMRDLPGLGLAATFRGRFGRSVQAGLFVDEVPPLALAVGEPGAAPLSTGRVLVLPEVSVAAPPLEIFQSTSGSGETPDVGDRFGWSLAAGDWDGDDDEELVIGSPGEGSGTGPNGGLVQVFGDSLGAFPLGVLTIDATQANDRVASFQNFGQSMALGFFDDTERANLAIGAPRADFRVWEWNATSQAALGVEPLSEAGQVHVLAPWRHPLGMEARVAAATNCQNELVFTIRPFDPVEIASTTKTMTVLLAAEAIQNNPMIDSSDVYTVPCWVANCFLGSQAFPPLEEGEEVRLIDLMRMAMLQSAGDACVAIADHLTGGVDPFPGCGVDPPDILCFEEDDIVLPTFVAMMNARAQELGMDDTEFTNPHGSTSGTFLGLPEHGPHHSTANDLAILGRAAMQNPLFAETVRRGGWFIQRSLGGNAPVAVWNPSSFVNSVHTQLVAMLPPPSSDFTDANGVKPGGNTYANNSGIASANNRFLNEPQVVAASSGTGLGIQELDDNWGNVRTQKITEMLAFAFTRCLGPGPGEILPPPPPENPGPVVILTGIPADEDSLRGAGAMLSHGGSALFVELVRDIVADPEANLRIRVTRQTQLRLAPGETATFGVRPFDEHLGFRIHNTGAALSALVELSEPPGTSVMLDLGPGEGHLLGGASAPGSAMFALLLTNTAPRDTAEVEVEELGYVFQVDLGGGPGSVFSSTLFRHPGDTFPEQIIEEQMAVLTHGLDPTPGNTLTLLVHDSGMPVSVEEGALPAAAGAALRLSAVRTYPNPFNPSVTIEFTLDMPASLAATIYDVAGRPVRTLADGTPAGAGSQRLVWDGRRDDGRPAGSGVYFYRIEAGRDARSGRFVLVK